MKLLKFDSYEEYKRVQTKVNKRKLKKVWVTDDELLFVAHFVQEHIPEVAFGLCHGVRNGYEVHKLHALLGVPILGTEIAETAHKFPHVIQWDFHEVQEEWIGNVDFIYSNSWDHSYDPERMLKNWMRCLRPHGRCFLPWTRDHDEHAVREADCFGLSLEEMLHWVTKDYELEKIEYIQAVRYPRWGKQLKNLVLKGRRGIKIRTTCFLVIKNRQERLQKS